MASLVEVYKSLFPDQLDVDSNGGDLFAIAPLLPADLFAFVGHVLDRSGAYYHVATDTDNASSDGLRKLKVDAKMRQRAIVTGRAWRKRKPLGTSRIPTPPKHVVQLWNGLQEFRDEKVFAAQDDRAEAPGWWVICLELLMISDEASAGVGFDADNTFSTVALSGYIEADRPTGEIFSRIQRAPFSLSTATEELLCVQPKSRTPTLGCTLRSLTHNLALLPPRGQVRARWVRAPFPTTPTSDRNDLGLLLIPFPYRIVDGSFSPGRIDPAGQWGWFEASQCWLPKSGQRAKRKKFVAFVLDLIDSARLRGERVDGIVLPELSIDYDLFVQLGDALSEDSGIDFLIAGVSSDPFKRKGNFVGIAPFFLVGDKRKIGLQNWEGLALFREKHHRWKLDRSQIEAYGLTSLDANVSWWEDITLLGRSLDILVYRGETTLTTLICEDLARVDPCQAVIRGVGPNLLIALLMDGPQIGARWPGRYATVLAEDPGTSTLSFTSFGLIARQNDLGKFAQAASVALWKDEATGVRNLELSRESDAIILRLKSVKKTERSLDGRSDGGRSHRWEYQSHQSVAASNRPDWVRTGKGAD